VRAPLCCCFWFERYGGEEVKLKLGMGRSYRIPCEPIRIRFLKGAKPGIEK
jgi:hypothetical protein